MGLIAGGVLSCLTFYGGMAVLQRLDRVAWKHELPPVAIGPDQKATLVVYFKHGTTNEQIEAFHSSVLTGQQNLRNIYGWFPIKQTGMMLSP